MTHRSSAAIAVLLLIPPAIAAQDRLKTMSGYDAARRVARDAPAAVTGGVTGVEWTDGGAFEYARDGKRYRFDVAHGRASEIDAAAAGEAGRGGRGRGSSAAAPERG